ncbi:MAG TPA: glycosyltransferase [Saprospiraceae bacterium]|nr:glycosyltransferase [Saprospiraceae bacterium]
MYWTGKLFVAPLFTGSGQQNKILEAMACGLPVITTSQVNNAIGAEVGTEIFIADNLRTFVAQIDDLLDDEDLRHEVAYQARRFVCDNYTWEIIGEKLEDFLRGTERIGG